MTTITQDDVAAHAAVLAALDRADDELRTFADRLQRKDDHGRVHALRTATAELGAVRRKVQEQLR